jgi:hypothetical protein
VAEADTLARAGAFLPLTPDPSPTQADEDTTRPKESLSKFARALQAAELLADSKGDYPAAASMLDAALGRDELVPNAQRIAALVFRAGLAITMSDPTLARRLLQEVRGIPVDDEREALGAELQRADDLAHMLDE